MALNEDGYPLCQEDFYSHAEFESHFLEAEQAIDEMISDAQGEEYLNSEQIKGIAYILDGASGAIYQARELFQEIVDTKIEASEAEFEAQEKAETVGVQNGA